MNNYLCMEVKSNKLYLQVLTNNLKNNVECKKNVTKKGI